MERRKENSTMTRKLQINHYYDTDDFNFNKNKGVPASLQYAGNCIVHKGEFVTDRLNVSLEDGIMLMLDCNYFLGQTDYKMELEYNPDKQEVAEEYMKKFNEMLLKENLLFDSKEPARISKSQRFFNALRIHL